MNIKSLFPLVLKYKWNGAEVEDRMLVTKKGIVIDRKVKPRYSLEFINITYNFETDKT